MVPRVFALASATSLAGLVAASTISGCSDDDNTATTSDAASDRRLPTPVDDGGGNQACFSETPVDATQFTYKPPTIRPGACTAQDIANLIQYVDDSTDATFADFQREINEKYPKSCAECIFGERSAATWAPILTEDGKVVDLNSSGCVQIASKKGDACGRAHWQWNSCIDKACFDCPADSAEEDECNTAVQSGACKTATDALAKDCGTSINTFITACRGKYGFDAWITRQCGGSPPDGGTGDAGPDGSSDAGADADAN
jgi:hypothetical protein